MLKAQQLADMERSMREEHRKDLEALERLKRFLPKNGSAPGPSGSVSAEPSDAEDDELDEGSPTTIIGTVDSVFAAGPTRRWTIPQMLEQLRAKNFPLKAKKPEATLGLVFKKLHRRGKIRLVRRGSGRTPHVYRANSPQEGDSDASSKSERPTQRQAVAVQ